MDENILDAIASAIQTFSAAVGNKNAASITALYSANATLLPPDTPMMKGKDAIQSYWQGAIDMGVKSAMLESVEIDSRQDIAYEVGRFELAVQAEGAGAAQVAGKYVVVWKLEDGQWRMHADIWNTDNPA